MPTNDPTPLEKAATGIAGLDDVLNGGLPREEMHLIQGEPGTGKTTLGLQFLLEGARAGEKTLYITLSQLERGLRKIADSHGWSLQGVHVEEFSVFQGDGATPEQQTIFHTADVELNETIDAIFEAVQRVQPDRLVLDSIAEVRLLADDPQHYYRQLLALRRLLADRRCTALVLDRGARNGGEAALQDISYGLIQMERTTPEYGNARRRLSVAKMRGMPFHGGFHNFRIHRGGVDVFPQIRPTGQDGHGRERQIESGIAELDALLGGGMDEGTSCLVVGPTGTGKTSIGTLYAHSAAKRGERSAIFLFDERPETFFKRSAGLGIDVRPDVEAGTITLRQVSTGDLSPGEFTQIVRRAVEDDGARVVLIDSLTGYFHAMPQETLLLSQMHELLVYLGQRGVLSFLVAAQHGMVGGGIEGPLDVSYMADSVLLLRHFEAAGAVRKALSVLKKRHGQHEKTIRELKMEPGRIRIGPAITGFNGVLSGYPEFTGNRGTLLDINNSEENGTSSEE